MITAVDTNILFDLLLPDVGHFERSARALTTASESGMVIVSEAVYAELAGRFGRHEYLEAFLEENDIQFQATGLAALSAAGVVWHRYTGRRPSGISCQACGALRTMNCEGCGEPIRSRQHLIADFLIGAHALHHAGRLLTRDRGIYRTYFPELQLV